MRNLLIPSLLVFSSLLAADEEAKKYQMPPNVKFTFPGILGTGEGGWVGSDHLLNLSKNVSVIVEIVKPENVQLPFTEEELRDKVLDIFEKEGLYIKFEVEEGKPPLPYFDLLVMAQRIEGGYTVVVEGRLYEQVTLKRVILPDEIFFQAITWEKQNLVVAATKDIKGHVESAVEEIAKKFTERVKFFEREKEKMKNQAS